MTNQEFTCWLSGYLELTDELNFTQKQFSIVKSHANLVQAVSNSLDKEVTHFMVSLETLLDKKSMISLTEIRCLFNETIGSMF